MPAPASPLYGILALASTGGTMFTIGIVFYTHEHFGWGLTENFRLAMVQGLVYMIGALSAHALTGRLPHRIAMAILHAVMVAACVVGVVAANAVAVSTVIGVLLVYTFFSAIAWPILESLVSLGTAGTTLARRLGMYNIIWPAVGVAVLAVSGSVIEHWSTGVFLVPALAHVVCIALSLLARSPTMATPVDSHLAAPTSPVVTTDVPAVQRPEDFPLHPEPDLLRVRLVALWVSRLALPATYAVVYGLMPLLPSLPAMARLDTATQTVVSAAWPAARWIAFIVLAAGTWWHTRPRVMVAAAVAMGIAFAGCALPPSQFLGSNIPEMADMIALIFWQVILGAALGIIYSGSLYFGMVLSEGSTEHSGYHEALIGLGWLLGPGAGVIMHLIVPESRQMAVAAVGSVIGLSVLCVIGASVIAGRRQA